MYIDRTDDIRPKDKSPLFLTLQAPYKAIASQTVSYILIESIKLAGLSNEYTAKDFRPTGATIQVEKGCESELVMQFGRWENQMSIFLTLCTQQHSFWLYR